MNASPLALRLRARAWFAIVRTAPFLRGAAVGAGVMLGLAIMARDPIPKVVLDVLGGAIMGVFVVFGIRSRPKVGLNQPLEVKLTEDVGLTIIGSHSGIYLEVRRTVKSQDALVEVAYVGCRTTPEAMSRLIEAADWAMRDHLEERKQAQDKTRRKAGWD